MYKRHLIIRNAVAVALFLSPLARLSAQVAVTSPPPGNPALAPADQNGNAVPAAQAEATTDRVFVTGSIIPTAAEVGPNPVINTNRDLINKSGERTAEELLRNLPIANANGVPVSNNENGSNTAVGGATIALRGFDARATLILLDGRRLAPYPVSNAGIVFIDLNSIPQSSIESIEILKDGASTTYGADAVAGVVNVKRYREYRGVLASVEYGNTTDKDSGSFQTYLLFGVGDGKTNVSGTINYYHRNSIFNRDRDYSAVPPFLSSNSSPYNLELSKTAVIAAGGIALPGAGTTQIGRAPFLTNGTAPASQYVYTTNYRNRFNFNQFSLSFPEQERYGGYVALDHKFIGDSLVVYGDFMYQQVKTHTELAPPATGNFQSAGQTTVVIPPRVPNFTGTTPLGGPTYAETGLTPGAFNPFNPFNQIISGSSRARLAEFGNRKFDKETEALLGTFGLRGDKLFDGTWGYDTGYRYSEIKNVATGDQVSISRFNRIVNQADPIFRPTSSQYIGTTTAFNPFGDYRVPIPSNQASVDFARIHPTDRDVSKLWTLDATVYTTSLIRLPAGGLGFAFGGQYRHESLEEAPDELNIRGDVAGNSPIQPARGGRKSFAFYTEASIPIFSQDASIPGFYALDITAAARYEEFRNNNTNVAVPKVGLRWQPFDSSLTLRGTWGKGFREPSLEELYSAPAFSIQGSNDPRRGGVFESETPVLTKSNPNLQPEDSKTYSAGLVYSPKFVPSLTLTLDFWRIERSGVVRSPFPNDVLQRELTNSLLAGERVIRLNSGAISLIELSNQNEAAESAEGIDAGIQFVHETNFGTFTSITQISYLNSFEVERTAGTRRLDLVSQTTDIAASNEGYYRWRGTTQLDWAWHGFDLVNTLRYTDGFRELDSDDNFHWVEARWLVDLQASYDFSALVKRTAVTAGYSKNSKEIAGASVAAGPTGFFGYLLNGTRLTIGCNNIFDRDPPKAFGEGGNAVGYPGFTYDSTGRFIYARLQKKF